MNILITLGNQIPERFLITILMVPWLFDLWKYDGIDNRWQKAKSSNNQKLNELKVRIPTISVKKQ